MKTKNNITIKDAMKTILSNDKINMIYVNDLINQVSKMTGYSKESVRGSSIGSTDKFMSESWFFENYLYLPQDNGVQAMIIKHKFLDKARNYRDNKPITKCYNSEEKKLARKFIFDNIKNINNPKILTFASEEGLDVKYIFEINKTAKIDNIERSNEILKKYKLLKLKTKDYNMTLSKFLQKRKNYKQYDLINYDTVGYLCKYISDDLEIINKYKKTNNLFLTIQDVKKIRNYGEFAETIRNRYVGCEDPTLSYITDLMTNYNFISMYNYRQSGLKIGMRILHFEVKK